MLFGYPVRATQNNWLHDCLCVAVQNIHTAADAGKRYPAWPRILPPVHQATLKSRTGLSDRFKTYNLAIRTLTKDNRDTVLRALNEENRIAELLSGTHECASVDELPEVIRQPIDSLFEFAFGLLTDLEVRDKHYEAIYAAIPDPVCPFCGTERFGAPGAPREALDHYLTRCLYPFAAANLRNLVPMGHTCNSSYKLACDVLRRADGSRRVAFDPYSHSSVRVSLDESEPFNGTTENTPRWKIRFDPETAATNTWDEVFSIRVRYQRDHLDRSFSAWLRHFRNWARSSGVQIDSDASIIAALRCHELFWSESGLQDSAFLKAAVFRMLWQHCAAGDQRLVEQIRNLLTPLPAPLPTGANAAPRVPEGAQ